MMMIPALVNFPSAYCNFPISSPLALLFSFLLSLPLSLPFLPLLFSFLPSLPLSLPFLPPLLYIV